MKLAPKVSKYGRNAVRVVGIDERPNTCFTTKRSGGELGALENAIFYKEIPALAEVPNKWFLFA